MHSRLGNRIHPVQRLTVQVIQLRKAHTTPEILTYLANAPLHLAFSLGAIEPTRARRKPTVQRVIQIAFIPDDLALPVPRDDRVFQVVVQYLAGAAAKILKGMLVAANEPVCAATDRKLYIHRPRPAQRHHKHT